MNTYGLAGKSVDSLLSLRKLADVSKEQYLNSIKQFLMHEGLNPDSLVTFAKERPKEFEDKLISFLQWKEGETSPSTAALIRNSLKRFLDVNYVMGIGWSHIDDHISGRKRYGKDRAPTAEEIGRMVNAADPRVKSIILFLSSSGARVGSLHSLRWRDIAEVKVKDLTFARVTIYRGEKEQYDSFITPEAYEQLLEYRAYRVNIGEKVTPQSPVFVTASNIDDFKPDRVRALATDTVKLLIARLQRQLGLREVLTEGKNAKRYEFRTVHGFRKFYKTRTEVAGVNRLCIEMTMGHDIGIHANYEKPSEPELEKEYAKAIDELTIIKSRQEVKKDEILTMFKAVLLTTFGYSEAEVAAMGNLDKLTPLELQGLIQKKSMSSLGLNGNRQKVVPRAEVKPHVLNGWEYVTDLPNEEAVVRLPS